MFYVREIPVVIEPGVGALEAAITVKDAKNKERTLAAHFYRVPLDEKTAPQLPMVPTTQHPHVFTIHEDLQKSPVLLVYDLLGRLTLIYTRDDNRRGWERNDVIAEHSGKSVTQFSVRFSFSSQKDRNRFMQLIDRMSGMVRDGTSVTKPDMTEAISLLSRARVAPALLPVAVAKSTLRNVRI